MEKVLKIIVLFLACIGFFVSFGLALHMKWFLAIPVSLGLVALGLLATPTIKEIYDSFING